MTDPLYRTEPTPFRVTIPVLGIPVQFLTNDAALLAAVNDAFGRWAATPANDVPSVHARLFVHQGNEGKGRSAVAYRMPDNERIVIHTRGSVAVTDPMRREVIAYTTAEFLADSEHFRYSFLEAAVFGLITRFDRQPFHAAALVRGETVVLLQGLSGAGKSTLTYAAMRAGIDVLAEDMVYLQSQPHTRVWGNASSIHLQPSARRHFPELETHATVRLANGKEKIVVRIEPERSARSPSYDRAGLCIVGERAARAGIERITAHEALQVVAGRLENGFDLFAEGIADVVQNLTTRGCWKLITSEDPHESIPLLHAMFDALDG